MKKLFNIVALAISVLTFNGIKANQVQSNVMQQHAAIMQHLLCVHNCCSITPRTLVEVQKSAAWHSYNNAVSYITTLFSR